MVKIEAENGQKVGMETVQKKIKAARLVFMFFIQTSGWLEKLMPHVDSVGRGAVGSVFRRWFQRTASFRRRNRP